MHTIFPPSQECLVVVKAMILFGDYSKQNKPKQRATLGPLHRSQFMAAPPGNTEALGPALSLSACHHDVQCLWYPYIMEWKGCRPWKESIHSALLTLCLFPKQDISAITILSSWLSASRAHLQRTFSQLLFREVVGGILWA